MTPPARKLNAAIFDCDGTLVDTMPIHNRTYGPDWDTSPRMVMRSLEPVGMVVPMPQ